MTQKIIFTGTRPDDGTGDVLRDAFSNVSSNFTELFANQHSHNIASNNWANGISLSTAANVGAAANAYADSLSYGNVASAIQSQINLSFNTANGAFKLANDIVSGAQVITNTRMANANTIIIKYDPNFNLANAPSIRFWSRKNPTPNIMFVQQKDDNFVFYTSNSNYTLRPVWSVFANTSNSRFRSHIPLVAEQGIKTSYGVGTEESFGNTGDVLVTAGGGTVETSSVTWQAPLAVSAKMFGAKGNGIDNDTSAIQNAINAAANNTTGSKTVYLPKGTYIITSPLDLKRKRVKLIGAGQTETIIKANTYMKAMIDVNDQSTDFSVLSDPFYIEKIKLWGNGNKANNGILATYRSNYHIRDVDVFECANGVVYSATSMATTENMKIVDCSKVGIYIGNDAFIPSPGPTILCGGLTFNNCLVSGNTSLGVRVYKANHIKFNSSEIQYTANTKGLTPSLTFENNVLSPNGTCVMVGSYDFAGSEVDFDNCLIGQNSQGPAFHIIDGLINVRNSWIYFGYTPTSYVMRSRWGTINVEGSFVVPQYYSTHDLIAYREQDVAPGPSGQGGKIRFTGCRGESNGLGDYSLKGDILNFGPMGRVFSPRLGKNLTKVSSGVTSTDTTNGLAGGNSRRFTVLSSSSGSSYLGGSAQLTGISDIRSNENMTLIVVYSSLTNVAVRLTESSANGGTVRTIGTLPNTNSQVKTYIKLDVQYPIDNKTYNYLEFHTSPAGQSSTWFQIDEVYFTDNHVLNAGQTGYGIGGASAAGSDWSNLHKC